MTNKEKLLEDMANSFPNADSADYWDNETARRTGTYDGSKWNQDVFAWYDKYLDKHRTIELVDWEGLL